MWVGPVRRPKRKSEKRSDKKSRTRTPKSVDFVLVYNRNSVTDDSYTKLLTFVVNLEQKGFELEHVTFSLDEDIIFLKIYVPENVLLHFAEIFGIELAFQNIYLRPPAPIPYRFMATELTLIQINGPIYRRKRDAVSGTQPKSITTAEKGLIIFKVLTVNSFGEEKEDLGVNKLLNEGVMESVYPLHEGPFQWSEEGSLNDRQLLTKYWSSMACWSKQQPLDLIEKYYGPQTAFYFAWLGFYNRMLIFASIVAFLFFVTGAVVFITSFKDRSEEVCNSNIMLCPRCLVKNCKYSQLKTSCVHSYLLHFFDNPLVMTFAALMSIWATVFLELWKREEAVLRIRWNLRSVEADYSMRPEFETKTKHRRVSKITGAVEPYMTKTSLCCRYTVTLTTVLLLIILTLLAILGVMVYVKTVTIALTQMSKGDVITQNVAMIASSTGACISVAFILVFELVYRKIALWLTNMENPRTQVDFDNSYTYKSYALAFVSNYSVVFYIAFIKGRFYTYPGDDKLWTVLGGLGSDLCDPAGCIIDLGIQMVIILLAKNFMITVKQYIVPLLMIWMNKLKKVKTKKNVQDPSVQWESDYLLNPIEKDQLMDEYLQMIIQYGFVTFFIAAFPLAPILALFNNLLELRVDAFKFTCTYRRPVAVKVASIGAWNGILQGVTYVGVATNAFVIAFTSELVQRTIYIQSKGDLVGFVNSTLSAFNVSEFPSTFRSDVNINVCYYPGKRYPPDHQERYSLTDAYWYELTMKLLAIVIFEHIVMILSGIIAYAIPDIPFSVREHVSVQREKIKEMKLNALQENYLKDNTDNKTNIFT